MNGFRSPTSPIDPASAAENLDANELLKRLKFVQEMLDSALLDKKFLEMEANKIKESAIETIVEKEHEILLAKNQVTDLESKLAVHVEEKLNFERETLEMKSKIFEMAKSVENDAKTNERRKQELETLISEGVEEKITEELKILRKEAKVLKERCREMEDRIRTLDSENNELLENHRKQEDRHKRELDKIASRFNGLSQSQGQDMEGELNKLTNRYEKQIAEVRKVCESQYFDLQAEKFELDLRKMELQKKLDSKEKELEASKDRYQKLLEHLQEKEELLLEKEWLILEMKQNFEDKINEMERAHSFERNDLAARLSDLKNEKLCRSSPKSCVNQGFSLSEELQNIKDNLDGESTALMSPPPGFFEKSTNSDADSLKDVTPKKPAEKSGQLKSLEILHSIAKKKINRLETEIRDLRSLPINPVVPQEKERIRPLLLCQDLERVLKEKNKLLQKLLARIDELEAAKTPSDFSQEFQELRSKLQAKGLFIEGAVLEIKERLKAGREVLDKEIDNLFDNIHKIYLEVGQRLNGEYNRNLLESCLKTLIVEEHPKKEEFVQLRADVLELLRNNFKDENIDALKKELFVRAFDQSVSKFKSIFSDLLSSKHGSDEKLKEIRREILEFLANEHQSQEINLIKSSLLQDLLKEELREAKTRDLIDIIANSRDNPDLAWLFSSFCKFVTESKQAATEELRSNLLREVLIKDFSNKLMQLFSGEGEASEKWACLHEEVCKVLLQSDPELDSLKRRALSKKFQNNDGNQVTLEEENKTDEDLVPREKELELKIEDLKKENAKLLLDIEKLKEKGRRAKPVPLMFAKTLVKL